MYPGVSRFSRSLLLPVVLAVAAFLVACGNGDDVTEDGTEANVESSSDTGESLPLRQWYPTPKTVLGPAYVPVMPYQTPEQSRPTQMQTSPATTAPYGQYGQYVWQPVPSAGYGYVTPPATAPQQGWGQQYLPVQPQTQSQVVPVSPQHQYQYQPQPAWPQQSAAPTTQLPGGGQQPYSQAAPQQYQYVLPAPAQDAYTYRPWGAASSEQNSVNQRNSINTWQSGGQPQTWGVPAYNMAPSQGVPQYGGYQGWGTPGYTW